jgi:hypothetical protein
VTNKNYRENSRPGKRQSRQGGKAMQQENRWRLLRPSLAVENVDAVDIHLPVGDRVHKKIISLLRSYFAAGA